MPSASWALSFSPGPPKRVFFWIACSGYPDADDFFPTGSEFDFQLPPPDQVFSVCRSRARTGSHPRVQHLTHEQVERQHDAYAALALIFCELALVTAIAIFFSSFTTPYLAGMFTVASTFA